MYPSVIIHCLSLQLITQLFIFGAHLSLTPSTSLGIFSSILLSPTLPSFFHQLFHPSFTNSSILLSPTLISFSSYFFIHIFISSFYSLFHLFFCRFFHSSSHSPSHSFFHSFLHSLLHSLFYSSFISLSLFFYSFSIPSSFLLHSFFIPPSFLLHSSFIPPLFLLHSSFIHFLIPSFKQRSINQGILASTFTVPFSKPPYLAAHCGLTYLEQWLPSCLLNSSVYKEIIRLKLKT